MDEATTGSAEHWNDAYAQGDVSRSWYQDLPAASLKMFDRCSVTPEDSVIDVGGGASRVVDALLARGHADVTILDISDAGLQTAQQRVGAAAAQVHWLVADLLT